MKSIFKLEDNQEIITRIEKLTPESQALWGKMTVDQMLKHCNEAIKVAFNEKDLNIPFIMRLFGSMLRKKVLNSEFGKNSPTAKEFKFTENFDLTAVKQDIITNFSRFQAGEKSITCEKHPFWGKMTSEDWNKLMWKHMDHHLRQFGV